MTSEPESFSGSVGKRDAKRRAPLTPAEILQLDAALLRAFETIQELRRAYPAAKHIKFPPLPPVYSESLVIAAARHIFGRNWTARYGGKDCDVIIEEAEGSTRRVEVKATAAHAFQEFKAKDLRADLIVWVRFGQRFQLGRGPIEIVVVEQPSQFIKGACRLDKCRFERLVKNSPAVKSLVFDSLEELLVQSSE